MRPRKKAYFGSFMASPPCLAGRTESPCAEIVHRNGCGFKMHMSEIEEIERGVRAALQKLAGTFEVLPRDPAVGATAAPSWPPPGFARGKAANPFAGPRKRGPKPRGVCLALATTRLDVNHAV